MKVGILVGLSFETLLMWEGWNLRVNQLPEEQNVGAGVGVDVGGG